MRLKIILLKCVLTLILILALMVCICILRAVFLFPEPELPQLCKETENHEYITLNKAMIKRFVDALKFRTITRKAKEYNTHELNRFIEFIQKSK